MPDRTTFTGGIKVVGPLVADGINMVPAEGNLEVDGDLSTTGDLDVAGALTLGTGLAAAEIAAQGIALLTHYSSGNQSAGTKKVQWIAPVAGTIVAYRARLDTAPTGQDAILDINLNGTTIFTTQANRPTVTAAGNNASTTAPEVTAVAAGDRISLDVDQVGSGAAGADLTVAIAIKAALV